MSTKIQTRSTAREARASSSLKPEISGFAPGIGMGVMVGCVTGAAFGSAGGSLGAAIGSLIGGFVGWHTGKGIAEVTDPRIEEAFWTENARLKSHSGK